MILLFRIINILIIVYICVSDELPVIDISPLIVNCNNQCSASTTQVIEQIRNACRTYGFFYITNHNISNSIIESLRLIAYEYFSLPQDIKDTRAMKHGGKAWRGYFRLGNEVTNGIPDQKEGYYFGTELSYNETTLPLHGPNYWPDGELGHRMKVAVLDYMSAMRKLGSILMKAIFQSLQIDESTGIYEQFDHPTELFRIFRYPPHNSNQFSSLSNGVGEHTDYGYLTILWQENVDEGGLQVKDITGKWIDAPPIPGTFNINLGDALEHSTGGLLRATPHRVVKREKTSVDRLSFPYFFDPSFHAVMSSYVPFMSQEFQNEVLNIKKNRLDDAVLSRWDKQDPTLFQGTYGKYLLGKVSKAFPELAQEFDILI